MAGDWNILALRGAYLNEAGLSCLGYIGKSASGMHKIVLVAQTRLNEAPKASKPCPIGLSPMRFDRGFHLVPRHHLHGHRRAPTVAHCRGDAPADWALDGDHRDPRHPAKHVVELHLGVVGIRIAILATSAPLLPISWALGCLLGGFPLYGVFSPEWRVACLAAVLDSWSDRSAI